VIFGLRAIGRRGRIDDHGSMTALPAPRGAPPPIRRLVLVPAGGRSESAVRRFRLARLRLEDREVARAERFAHLKATHD
jgi:hypothetical protein